MKSSSRNPAQLPRPCSQPQHHKSTLIIHPPLLPLLKPPIQHPNQFVQPLHPQSRMLMLLQIPITFIRQQHSRRPRFVPSRHIIDRVTNLSKKKPCIKYHTNARMDTHYKVAGRTMISPAPLSSKSHALAMCKIPAGSGFGGWKSRVMIGAKVLPGRWVERRCVTGPLLCRKQNEE